MLHLKLIAMLKGFIRIKFKQRLMDVIQDAVFHYNFNFFVINIVTSRLAKKMQKKDFSNQTTKVIQMISKLICFEKEIQYSRQLIYFIPTLNFCCSMHSSKSENRIRRIYVLFHIWLQHFVHSHFDDFFAINILCWHTYTNSFRYDEN